MPYKGAVNLALGINYEYDNASTGNIDAQLRKHAKYEENEDAVSNNGNGLNASFEMEKPVKNISVKDKDLLANGATMSVGYSSRNSTSFSEKPNTSDHRKFGYQETPCVNGWKNELLDSKDAYIANKVKNDDNNDELTYRKSSKLSPFDRGCFISKYLTFWWMQNLFTLGNKKNLGPSDLFEMPSKDKTDKISEQFEREWNKEAYDANGNLNKNASLLKVVFRVYGYQYMLLGIPSITMECFRIAQAILLGRITSYFAPDTKSTLKDVYLYGFGFTVCSLMLGWHFTATHFIKQQLGMRARVALSAMVYKKVLRLSSLKLAGTTTGHMVNLVSVDAQKLDLAAMYLHYLWIGPVVLCVSGYLLWQEIGISGLVGIGLLLILAPLQIMIGQLLMNFRRDAVKFTDKRVKIINEIITGIRVIKMNVLEHYFTKIVDESRMKEIHAIRKLSYLRAGFISFFFTSASFVSFITFTTYALIGNLLTAQKVFTSLSLFQASRLVMTLFFPHAVTLLNEARVSIERIQGLLLMDELHASNQNLENLEKAKSVSSSIRVENLHASWTKDAKTLRDINIAVSQGELAAIVGPVGSGKSSLLLAILGELLPDKGSVNTTGKIAYVSQEAWIFNGTLKKNITFGQELDDRKYRKVIEICALEKDIQMLPEGDLTLVGEKGVSLSGGQKARVNLARAVYYNADIYIFDDPLSAVDASVGRHLFDQCINGYLSNKVRVLVTHQLQYLSDANEVLILSQGRAVAKGNYSCLKSAGINFADLLDSGDVKNAEFNKETFERPFRRHLSISNCDVRARSGTRNRKISQVSFVDPINIGSDLSVASIDANVEEFEEKEIPKETKCEGTVTFKTYLSFFRVGYGLFIWGLLMLLFAFCQAIFIGADLWLSHWTTQEESFGKIDNRDRNLSIYGVLVASLLILGLIQAVIFSVVILKSSENLHNRMLRSVMRVPVRFYDQNSIGRILNRFSKDMSLIDDRFTFILFDFLQTTFVVIGIVLLVCVSNPVIFAVVAPIIVLFFLLRRYHIKTAREVKRIEGLNRSPVFGHLSTTLLGLPVIRAYQMQQKFTDFHNQYQDEHTKSWVTFLGCGAWLAFRMELLSVMFISFAVFMSIVLRNEIGLTAGQVGLMLAYTADLVNVVQHCVRHSTEVENHMTSVERVIEYTELESEAPEEANTKPPDEWPQRGSIRFNKMTFAHAPNLPNILTGVTAHIKSNEKIGICGRTAAGKSSLLSALFRTNEPKGEIIIDGVNVLELGLKDLRSKISIIPQDPVLFSGTMRGNLDPFAHYSDIDLWNALEEVRLQEAVEALPGKLSYEIAEFGQNLSVGQRQLVCLARAILKKNKILVIDEATASVDQATDNFIQTTIREKFKDCTVLTIAHRLNTIMDSDRIMVLDAGRLKEFDEPYNLLRYKNTLLYQLVKQTGQGESQILLDMARKSFEAKRSKNGQSKSIWRDGIQFIVSIEIGNASGIDKNGKSIPTDNDKS